MLSDVPSSLSGRTLFYFFVGKRQLIGDQIPPLLFSGPDSFYRRNSELSTLSFLLGSRGLKLLPPVKVLLGVLCV